MNYLNKTSSIAINFQFHAMIGGFHETDEKSFLSERFPGLPLSSASLSGFLRTIGSKREMIARFMDQMIDGSEHILFDGTNIITKSENLDIN